MTNSAVADTATVVFIRSSPLTGLKVKTYYFMWCHELSILKQINKSKISEFSPSSKWNQCRYLKKTSYMFEQGSLKISAETFPSWVSFKKCLHLHQTRWSSVRMEWNCAHWENIWRCSTNHITTEWRNRARHKTVSILDDIVINSHVRNHVIALCHRLKAMLCWCSIYEKQEKSKNCLWSVAKEAVYWMGPMWGPNVAVQCGCGTLALAIWEWVRNLPPAAPPGVREIKPSPWFSVV
jgi:hypothetical protein